MKKTTKGLLGIIGIWLTMALMPLAELLQLTPFEATFWRGLSGLLILGTVGVLFRRTVTRPDRQTVRVVVLFVIATVCLFQATTAWGASYMALFLDLAVLVPLWFAWRYGAAISKLTWFALVAAIIGTALALRISEGGEFSYAGLLWSFGALLANGLYIQYAGHATQPTWNKVFWMSAGLVLVGLPYLTTATSLTDASGSTVLLVLLFAIGTGIMNFYAGFMALENLRPVAVGVLVLGVTPTIIISSYFMLGRAMGVDQLLGVALTLGAVLVFGRQLRQQQ